MALVDKSIFRSASLCIGILLLSTPPTMADREVGDQVNLIQRLRKQGFGKRAKGSVSDRYDAGAASRIRLRPKVRSGSSILTRSLILAAILCTVRFLLPRARRWISECCRGMSEVKRSLEARSAGARHHRSLKRAKSRRDEGSDAQTISPSVMEIIDLGEDSDDGDSSLNSTISAISSASTFLSFSMIRRKRVASSSEAAEATRRSVKSSARTTKRPLSNSITTMPISNSSARSKQQINSLGRLMNFIDEDDHAFAATSVKSESSADASGIPTTFTNDRGRGCDDRNGPSEKLSAGYSRGSTRTTREQSHRTVRSRR